ncbi:unnamed protein product, partial [Urochloa humidicola]
SNLPFQAALVALSPTPPLAVKRGGEEEEGKKEREPKHRRPEKMSPPAARTRNQSHRRKPVPRRPRRDAAAAVDYDLSKIAIVYPKVDREEDKLERRRRAPRRRAEATRPHRSG